MIEWEKRIRDRWRLDQIVHYDLRALRLLHIDYIRFFPFERGRMMLAGKRKGGMDGLMEAKIGLAFTCSDESRVLS